MTPRTGSAGGGTARALPYATVTVAAFALALAAFAQLQGAAPDHYVYLARAFAQGVPWVEGIPNYPDVVQWNGRTFIPLGPLPAVVLLPFLPLLNAGMQVVWVSTLFTLLNVALLRRVLGQVGVVGERRAWALLLFFASTPYLGVWLVGSSYYFAHVIAVTCVLLAMTEALGPRNRAVLVGLALGLGFATRQTILFGAPFALWLAWRASGGSLVALARYLALLGVGLAGPVAAVLVYNWVRFGNPIESGYALTVLQQAPLEAARGYGLFSIVHVPKNLFMLLLQGPRPFPDENAPILLPPYLIPSPWGMGLLFTSPALAYAFRADRRNPAVQAAWLAALATLVPLVTYYGVGWIQLGYRYALDFLPYLAPVAALGLPAPSVGRGVKALVLVGVAVCLWGTVLLYAILR